MQLCLLGHTAMEVTAGRVTSDNFLAVHNALVNAGAAEGFDAKVSKLIEAAVEHFGQVRSALPCL